MKFLIVAYINSDSLLEQLEGIICYDNFQVTETNHHFRAFSGYFNGPAVVYFNKLYYQLQEFEFDIEDSIFLSYSKFTEKKVPTISTLVVKRKGNKYLRKLEYK